MNSLLARPPEEAARIFALTQLAKAEEAAARLADPDDSEALHDFRVSLRRLRSVLRSYPRALSGSLSKAHRKRLRALAHDTGAGRDAEVALGWVEGQRERLPQSRQSGLDWLSGRLAKRKSSGYQRVHRRLEDEFAPLAADLQRRLGVYTREIRIDEGSDESFGERVATRLRGELVELEELLRGIVSVEDSDRCHRARLAVKRLRYLLEPLTREVPEAEEAVGSFKRLQDLLGEINDSHVLEGRLASAVTKAARQRARTLFSAAVGRPHDAAGGEPEGWAPVDGLLAVAGLNRERRDALFAELEAGWTGSSAEEPERGERRRELVRRLGELAQTLSGRGEDVARADEEPAPPAVEEWRAWQEQLEEPAPAGEAAAGETSGVAEDGEQEADEPPSFR